MTPFFLRLRRILSGLLACILLLISVVGCSSKSSAPIKPSEQDIKVVATCGGYDVYYEELRYVVMSYKNQFVQKYGSDVWKDPAKSAKYLPLLKEKIEENLTVNYAIMALSKDFQIDINDQAIQDGVQKLIDETVASLGGRSEYIKMLEQMYMTDHFVRFTLSTDLCETELVYALMDIEAVIRSEKEFLEYALNDDNFCATLHVYVGNDEGESVEENRALAEELLQNLEDGSTIEQLIGSKYNDDIYESGTPYHFTRGEYEKEYEEAAFALRIGEHSGVVECEDGFYIIERRELSEAYILGNLTELLHRYQYASVETLIDKKQAELKIEWNDYGNSLDWIAMK